MKVYVVGDHGPEHNHIRSIHKTYKGALREWNKLRLELLRKARSFMKKDKFDKEMWKRMIKNLSCRNPKKIDNYPHETPFIEEWEVKR